MEILSSRTAYIPIRPYVSLRSQPKNYWQRFEGDDFFLNNILYAGRLNATFTAADTPGVCRWRNQTSVCTGILDMLMKDQVDASLFTAALTSYEDGNLMPKIRIGPFSSEFKRVFLSTPQEEAKYADVDPMVWSRKDMS